MVSLEQITTDAMVHFGAGVFVSTADYLTVRWHGDNETQLEENNRCVDSMVRVLEANDEIPVPEDEEPISKDSLQYHQNMLAIQDYLETHNINRERQPAYKRLASWFKSIGRKEKINHLPKGKQLWLFALGAEMTDTLVGMGGYYLQVMEESPLGSFWNNIYEVPSFWAGLVTGRAVRHVGQALRPRELKKSEKNINNLLRETPILDYVVAYTPPPAVKDAMRDDGRDVKEYRLTAAGKSLFKKVSGAAENVTGYFSRENDESERQKRIDRFREITRGH